MLRVRKSRVAVPPLECPLSTCMSLLAGAWTSNVIWYLSAGPRRFGELKQDIPPITAKVLSTRLRELEARRLVARKVLATSPPSVEYALTPLGREVLPVIDAIIAVGARIKQIDRDEAPPGGGPEAEASSPMPRQSAGK